VTLTREQADVVQLAEAKALKIVRDGLGIISQEFHWQVTETQEQAAERMLLRLVEALQS